MKLAVFAAALVLWRADAATLPKQVEPAFTASDRCLACHNNLRTVSGEDVSIGSDWRTSAMANASRDPYWQGSVRREIVDHPESQAVIEDKCSTCHMPMVRYEAKLRGKSGEVFAALARNPHDSEGRKALDGVSCSVCHQIGAQGLGKPESFSGGFVIDAPDASDNRPVFGPFDIASDLGRIMRSSSEGYSPKKDDHIRQSELCATCHTLYNQPLGPGAASADKLPEQVPYLEWLHSDYKDKKSCQSCHMPAVDEMAPITSVLGQPREGTARHVFVGANFFLQRMLYKFGGDLRAAALPEELNAASERTMRNLQTQAARVAIEDVTIAGGRLQADIFVENLGGHKLPTAYPSRRVWLHVTVRDGSGRVVFESGKLRPDGSIQGNPNDADPTRFEPHHDEIRTADQVQIYESILGEANGAVTTGLLTAVNYLKDNRLLPHGFDKSAASKDIAVTGEAAADANFTGAGDRVRYTVPWTSEDYAYEVEAEALYQPIGYRWAANLKKYPQAEPNRFNGYFDSMSSATAVSLARAVRKPGK